MRYTLHEYEQLKDEVTHDSLHFATLDEAVRRMNYVAAGTFMGCNISFRLFDNDREIELKREKPYHGGMGETMIHWRVVMMPKIAEDRPKKADVRINPRAGGP